MKAILIDPALKMCSEVEYDATDVGWLRDLMGDQIESRTIRPNELLLFPTDLRPDAANGFLMPLPSGSVRCQGPALVMGMVGGKCVDTAMTAAHVIRGLFW